MIVALQIILVEEETIRYDWGPCELTAVAQAYGEVHDETLCVA